MATPATTPETNQLSEDEQFESRHKNDLSAKRFAYVAGVQTIVPLLTMAVGGALGYFTLGKPLRMMFPKLMKGSGHLSDVAFELEKLKPEKILANAQKIAEIAGSTIERMGPEFKIDSAKSLWKLVSEAKEEEVVAIKNLFGIETKREIMASKTAGAFIGGTLGGIGGSVAVGYDKWRKEESERLAAEEINRDVARLELFKPSDAQLVAENKRLRAMLDNAPADAKVNSIQHKGQATQRELQIG